MNLTATTHTLELVTLTAATVEFDLSWSDVDRSAATAVIPGSASGSIASATTTTVVSAPGASVYRALTSMQFRNVSGSVQTVTVQRDIAGTNRVAMKAAIGPGEGLHYERGRGWYVMTAAGETAQSAVAGLPGADGAGAIQTATFPFGGSFTDTAEVTVTDAGIGTGSVFLAQINGGSTADNSADVHAVLGQYSTIEVIPAAGSALFRVQLDGIKVTGDVRARYTYS